MASGCMPCRCLRLAEEIARARGCVGIRLDTTSFQAPEFYLRHGYAEFGRIEGYPPGHTAALVHEEVVKCSGRSTTGVIKP
jgi:ribosomal protein S18 acetylase RimI-like enzyme